LERSGGEEERGGFVWLDFPAGRREGRRRGRLESWARRQLAWAGRQAKQNFDKIGQILPRLEIVVECFKMILSRELSK